VLAHELGHLEQRHSLRQAISLAVIPVMMTVIAGDLIDASQVAASIPVVLLEQGYSRDHEREADKFARELLWQMGTDTQPVAALFAALSKGEEESDMDILSTHPGMRERIEFFSENKP
jgi:Zn-dependent protease with chaperone function